MGQISTNVNLRKNYLNCLNLFFLSRSRLSQFCIINVMRNVLPKGLQLFFFCFAFLIEPFVLSGLHLILLPLALLHPASLHVGTKVAIFSFYFRKCRAEKCIFQNEKTP